MVRLLSFLALISTAAMASGPSMSLSRTPNMDGVAVPEVVIVVARGGPVPGRQAVQSEVARLLGTAGVRPGLIELQSVATSAINMASDPFEGTETICYESWCARVYLAD